MATAHSTEQSAIDNPASSINPMIDDNGDPYRVCSALEAISNLLDQRQKVTFDEAQSYGISILLSTCAAALRSMEEAKA